MISQERERERKKREREKESGSPSPLTPIPLPKERVKRKERERKREGAENHRSSVKGRQRYWIASEAFFICPTCRLRNEIIYLDMIRFLQAALWDSKSVFIIRQGRVCICSAYMDGLHYSFVSPLHYMRIRFFLILFLSVMGIRKF